MNRSLLPAALTLLLSLAVPDRARTQPYRVNAPSIGLHLNQGSWGYLEPNGKTEGGLGAGFTASAGLSSRVSLALRTDITLIAPEAGGAYRMNHTDLSLRYHFGDPASHVRPYAGLTGTFFALNQKDPVLRLAGLGAGLTAGLQYFLTPAVALHAAVVVNGIYMIQGKFGGIEVDMNPDYRAVRSQRALAGLTIALPSRK